METDCSMNNFLTIKDILWKVYIFFFFPKEIVSYIVASVAILFVVERKMFGLIHTDLTLSFAGLTLAFAK